MDIKANIELYTNLNVSAIDKIILSAGSIKATVIFKESVSKEDADSAKTNLAASPAIYMVGTSAVPASGYTIHSPDSSDPPDSSTSIPKHNMLMSVSFVIMTLAILY